MASRNAVMEQPNKESDSGDTSVAQLQEIVVSRSEDSQTGVSLVAELQENVIPSSEDPQTGDASIAKLQEIVVSPSEDLQTGVALVAELEENIIPSSEDSQTGDASVAELQENVVPPSEDPQTGDASIAELQEIVVPPSEDGLTGDDSVAELQENAVPPSKDRLTVQRWFLESFHEVVGSYLGTWRNSSNQIPEELTTWDNLLGDTIVVVEDAKGCSDDIMVKSWIAEMEVVLSDTFHLFLEIKNANIFGQTAEVQSSANKPWKLILNLFNKISRFMHYYQEKRMLSLVKHIIVRLEEILVEGKQLLEEIPDERTKFGRQDRLTTFDHNNAERKRFANVMLGAIYKGMYLEVRRLFGETPDAMSRTFKNGQTALHVAITAGQLRVAKELIIITSTEANNQQLEIKDESGNTALSFAARNGMMEIAKCLIEKNKNLLTIPDGDDKLPVQLACTAGHEDMTRYLYRNTPRERLRGDNGFYLLEECITKKMFDIALHLLRRFPKFAIYRIFHKDTDPIILTLAQTLPPFVRGNQLAFWRRWIYNFVTEGIRVKWDRGTVLSDVGMVAAQRRAAKKIYDLKLMDAIACEIIRFIRQQLSALDGNEFERSGAVEATFQAIKNGLPEIVIEIAEVNTNILWNRKDPEDSRNMFACAVAYRQEEVAQLLYGLNARIATKIVFTLDRDRNNLLHLAAKLAPRSDRDHISGAARLQSELRWFNAVKAIVPQFYNYDKNKDGDTPSQVFVKEHEKLLKEAEEWVKKTAESSTVVGTLIITIMFAVAFTVPGGNDQNTGFPIFLNKTTDSSTVPSPTVPFMVFVVSDAISLFAASSSVLMFLGILASRYDYEDFFKSLPVKLIIGISSLFISIAAMMVAFCVALFIMLQGHLWVIIPVTLLAGIPIIIFVLLLSPFLVELYTMTFGPGIFDRKKNSLG